MPTQTEQQDQIQYFQQSHLLVVVTEVIVIQVILLVVQVDQAAVAVVTVVIQVEMETLLQ